MGLTPRSTLSGSLHELERRRGLESSQRRRISTSILQTLERKEEEQWPRNLLFRKRKHYLPRRGRRRWKKRPRLLRTKIPTRQRRVLNESEEPEAIGCKPAGRRIEQGLDRPRREWPGPVCD